MNNLLNSIKSDLSDRRLLPIVVLLGLALAAAIAYSVLAGGSSGSPATPIAATGAGPTTAPSGSRSVTLISANSHAAVSETTDGASYQRQEGAHDPFVQLPVPAAPKTQTSSTKASGASSTTTSAPSGQTTATKPSSGGGTTPAPAPQPAPHKPKVVHRLVFNVGVLFGLAPTTPGQTSQLTPYADLKRLEPLPSSSEPLVMFEGASSDRKSAIFTLTREAIVKGAGICLPSSVQCEAVQLAVGQSEELQYLQANGESVTYELALVTIAWHETTTTEAKAARLDRPAHAGQALLRRLDLPVQSHLRFSSAKGVLVYVAHRGL
jgi:hypothetical protein